MSEIMLCNAELAEQPYYLRDFDISVYSVEELCFCLLKNLHMLGEDTLDERVCEWLEEQQGLSAVAQQLRSFFLAKAPLGKAILLLFERSGYLYGDALYEAKRIMMETQGQKKHERGKTRADYLLSHKKYALAAKEYYQILKEPRDENLSEVFYGNILHNMGNAYAKLFFYQKAGICFKRAYELNKDEDTLKQYLAAIRMLLPKEEYVKQVVDELIEEKKALELEETIQKILLAEEESRERKEYQSILKMKKEGQVSEYYRGLQGILERWKKDYRRNMADT